MRSDRVLATLTVMALGATSRVGAQHVVYHVPLVGTVELPSSRIVSRALETAERAGVSAVVLDFALSGGRMDMAQIIVGDLNAANVPVYALVSQQALGAAALIALAADSIFMVPGATLGAGSDGGEELTPAARRATIAAFTRAAGRRGYDPNVVAAMADDQIAIDDLTASGELLTLNTENAARLGISARTVENLGVVLSLLGLGEAEVVGVGSEWTGVTVEVTNTNWRDARVYVERAGSRFRLGTVTSMNTREFNVPEGFLSAGSMIRVLAEIIGTFERITTPQVRSQPGLVIEWDIANMLSQSSMTYYVRN